MNQQPDLSAFVELVEKWLAEEAVTEQRIPKFMATYHELLWMQSYRTQLEDAIKKASGSAENTSEAMGNLSKSIQATE